MIILPTLFALTLALNSADTVGKYSAGDGLQLARSGRSSQERRARDSELDEEREEEEAEEEEEERRQQAQEEIDDRQEQVDELRDEIEELGGDPDC